MFISKHSRVRDYPSPEFCPTLSIWMKGRSQFSFQDERMRLVDNLSVSSVNVGGPEATRPHIRGTLKNGMMDLMIDGGEGARALCMGNLHGRKDLNGNHSPADSEARRGTGADQESISSGLQNPWDKT